MPLPLLVQAGEDSNSDLPKARASRPTPARSGSFTYTGTRATDGPLGSLCGSARGRGRRGGCHRSLGKSILERRQWQYHDRTGTDESYLGSGGEGSRASCAGRGMLKPELGIGGAGAGNSGFLLVLSMVLALHDLIWKQLNLPLMQAMVCCMYGMVFD